MKFEYSLHWLEERVIRKDITDDIIEFCILKRNLNKCLFHIKSSNFFLEKFAKLKNNKLL